MRRGILGLLLVVALPLLGSECSFTAAVAPAPAPDVNDDGTVDVRDVVIVQGCNPTASVAAAPDCAAADVDADGDVDDADADAVGEAFGHLVFLAGDLVPAGAPNRPPFAEVGGVPAGSFRLDAASSADDLRLDPGDLAFTLADGALTATPTGEVGTVRRIDPSSGLPLREDAVPGASCPTGAEADCWQPGDAEGPSLGAWQALCTSTLFVAADIDPSVCLLTLLQSHAPTPAGALVSAMNSILSGQTIGALTLASLGGFTPATTAALQAFPAARDPFDVTATPLRALNGDPADTTPPLPGGTALLNPFLTLEQQARLGCGSVFGTVCDLDGVDLFRSAAGAFLAVWPEPAAPGCARVDGAGTWRVLPGCGRPGFPGHDLAADGSVAADDVDPFTEVAFDSEMELFSWNALMMAVALSTGLPAEDVFDPDDPLRTDGCSMLAPEKCRTVQDFASYATVAPGDDPREGPPLRWLWEQALAFEVTAASGSLAPYQGWSLYAFGPETARTGTRGMGFVLEPPPGAVIPSAPFLVRSLGPDSILGTADDPFQGVAYGLAP